VIRRFEVYAVNILNQQAFSIEYSWPGKIEEVNSATILSGQTDLSAFKMAAPFPAPCVLFLAVYSIKSKAARKNRAALIKLLLSCG
jgi:hypothetical protein